MGYDIARKAREMFRLRLGDTLTPQGTLMSVSFVNGYLCTSGCDESKAKRGVDPHPSTNADNVNGKDEASRPGRADQPAVLFGGSLLPLSGTDSVQSVNDAQPSDPSALQTATVDLLV
jgi:hypothetical protein